MSCFICLFILLLLLIFCFFSNQSLGTFFCGFHIPFPWFHFHFHFQIPCFSAAWWTIAKSFWGHHVNVYYVMAIPQICDTCIAKNRSKSEILYLCLNIPKNWVRRITKHDTACEQALSGTLVAGRENECPTRACSRLNIILLSQNRLQMIIQVSLFEQRGGAGIWTLPFSPL